MLTQIDLDIKALQDQIKRTIFYINSYATSITEVSLYSNILSLEKDKLADLETVKMFQNYYIGIVS